MNAAVCSAVSRTCQLSTVGINCGWHMPSCYRRSLLAVIIKSSLSLFLWVFFSFLHQHLPVLSLKTDGHVYFYINLIWSAVSCWLYPDSPASQNSRSLKVYSKWLTQTCSCWWFPRRLLTSGWCLVQDCFGWTDDGNVLSVHLPIT